MNYYMRTISCHFPLLIVIESIDLSKRTLLLGFLLSSFIWQKLVNYYSLQYQALNTKYHVSLLGHVNTTSHQGHGLINAALRRALSRFCEYVGRRLNCINCCKWVTSRKISKTCSVTTVHKNEGNCGLCTKSVNVNIEKWMENPAL